MENTRFIYGLPVVAADREQIFKFCRHFKIGVQLYTKTHPEAESFITDYEQFLKDEKDRKNAK
jgi:hypothetical protein